MGRKIIIYGASKRSFPTSDDLKQFIKNDVFMDGSRFDYSQTKEADVIVLSFDGWACGHFDIAAKVKPNKKEQHNGAKATYLVKKPTVVYENPVRLLPLGIKGIRFGTPVSEELFQKIQAEAQSRECAYQEPAEVPIGSRYTEGAVKRILVDVYERDPAARAACIAHFGTRCRACGVDLGERYGEIGRGFIHVHHLKLLSEVGKQYKVNPLVDLLPVCPNCHAILYRTSPPMSIEELRSRLQGPKPRVSRV
jgi:hypothetical protein